MLSSTIGGKDNLKKVLDILSDADRLKKLITEIDAKEDVIRQASVELYKGKSAQGFHDSLVASMTEAKKDMEGQREYLSSLKNELADKERFLNQQSEIQRKQFEIERYKLQKIRVELDREKEELNQIKADLADKEDVLDVELTEAKEMKVDLEKKIREFEGMFNNFKTGS